MVVVHPGGRSLPALRERGQLVAARAQCRSPRGNASAQHTTTTGTVLEYSNAQLLVTLPAQGAPSFQMLKVFREGGQYRNVAINVDEDFAIGRLHCEAR